MSTFSQPGQALRGSLSVLIVDDDPLLGEFLAMQLEMLGCVATSVETALAALQVLATQDIHLLVTDWQMPVMDGMELVRKVRAERQADSFLHIAMMTARGEERVIRAAMEAGVDDFLYKPIQEVELELAVESASRNRQLHYRLMRRNTLLARAHKRTREALERVNADLEAATAMHRRLLPADGERDALSLRHIYRPAAILGGDSIGVCRLDGGGLLFFLIDVCGHGVPAALDSFHLHHRIKGLSPSTPEALGSALASLNREICGRGDDSYATIAAGLVFPDRAEGWIACAGHPAPLLELGGTVTQVEGGRAMPVGWFEHVEYAPVRFDFPAGARFAVFSDGITECTDRAGEEFGIERLEELFARTAGTRADGEADPFIGRLEQELVARSGIQGFADDVSLLAIEHRAA